MAVHPLILAAATLPALASLPMAVAQQTGPQAADVDVVATRADRHDRMTVPVRIGKQGPFAFLIDTGAERTVLSHDVAARLALVPSGRATLVGVAGSQDVDLVDVEELALGRRSFYGLSAPLLDAAFIGADGIVGLDSLQGQRVLLDFDRNRMAIGDAAMLGGNGGYEIVVQARRRSGQLIMANAQIDGVRTEVVIDTGADTSIGNRALQRALARRHKGETTELISVTGQSITADVGMGRAMTLEGLKVSNMAIAFADAPAFERLNMVRRPALLMGMAQLRLFHRVAIDFATRRILFDLPTGLGW